MQDVDAALVRRFERRILIPLPEPAARRDFLEKALARPEMEHDLTPDDVAVVIRKTDGYSCSDLAAVCRDAALCPVRELMERCPRFVAASPSDEENIDTEQQHKKVTDTFELRKLTLEDFIRAMERCRPSGEDQNTFAHHG